MKRLLPIIAALCALVSCITKSEQGKLEINERGYFESQGVNVLVYSNRYQGVFCDEKTAGIEIIQRGVRIATGGGVRLMNTPEQWDIYSTLTERTIDTLGGVINCRFNYQDYNFQYGLTVKQEGKGLRVSVELDDPVPEQNQPSAPARAVMLPTGSSAGAATVRASVSATSRKNAPKKSE